MIVKSMWSAGLLSLCRAFWTQLLLVMGEPELFGYELISTIDIILVAAGASGRTADVGLHGQARRAFWEGTPVHAGRCHAEHSHALRQGGFPDAEAHC